MRTDSSQTNFRLSGSDLKIIACISMFADHFAVVFDFSGMTELILRDVIGRLAFPIFAFLLVEGFLHTRNLRRYFFSLLGLGCLSEMLYDLAAFSTGIRQEALVKQNTLFTLSLALLMLFCIRWMEDFLNGTKKEALPFGKASDYTTVFLISAGIICCFGAAAQVLHLDYGFTGIACIGAMYLFRINTVQSVFWGCVCLNLDFFSVPGAFLSLLPLSRYNGTRGRQNKWFFYLFYPLHLLFLLGLKALFDFL